MNVHSEGGVFNSMDKKASILHSTLKLITENGFHATPVSLIASDSGVAAGTIYRYFKNKNDIINELYANVKKDFNDAILKGMEDGFSEKEEYSLKWKNMINYFIKNPLEAKFMDQFATSPFINKEIVKSSLARYYHLRDLYKRAATSGAIRDVSYEAVMVAMLGTVNQLYRTHNSGMYKVDEKVINEVFEIFWLGIKK